MAARKAAKPKARRKAPARAASPPLPPESGETAFHELSRDQLSVFLYLALLPEETAALVREWGLSQPGFRPQALGEIQRCDLLADEIRAVPARSAAVLELLRKAFGPLPLAAWRIDGRGAEELGGMVQSEAALALVLWRLLADPAAEVQAVVRPWLEDLARRYYGPPEGGGEQPAAPGRGPAEGGPEERLRKLEAELARERKTVAEERARAEAARRKEEEAREKLQAQLKEARSREAQAADEAARAREAAEAARREQLRAEAAAAALRGEDAHGEAQRARAQARELEGKVHALESRLERAREREAELEAEVASARAAAPTTPASPGPAAPEAEGEEAQASWLFPVYTREFYDSLEGWDRRIQRAAFKQAHLLAQDHRHPSLRALPLEGLPGYYRVRVATDVRLLYRRGERQNAVEILSLIDREDLDRYVRQAKTR